MVQEMLFKDISYLELWQPFCSGEWNHLCNFGRGHHEEQFCKIILNLDQRFRSLEEMSFIRFLILSSGGPLILQFGRGHYGEQSCEIILNLGQWFREKFTHAGQRLITRAHLRPANASLVIALWEPLNLK